MYDGRNDVGTNLMQMGDSINFYLSEYCFSITQRSAAVDSTIQNLWSKKQCYLQKFM